MAKIGFGTTYEIWDPRLGTPAFVELGEVISVTPPNPSQDAVDDTHMKSPGRKRTFIAGLIDGGEGSVEVHYDPDNATAELVRAAMDNGDVEDHKITFPDAETVTFKALITGIESVVPLDDKMVATFTVKVSGAETWA